MERNRETQVNMTTFAEISAIKKTAEKGDRTTVTSGEFKKNNNNRGRVLKVQKQTGTVFEKMNRSHTGK